MWGQSFFLTRDHLENCHKRIVKLANLIDLPDVIAENEAGKKLGRPWLAALIGDINAGKSSLINALVGKELAEVGVVPTTRETRVYSQKALRMPPNWQLRKEASPNLRNISWIDTPGLNSADGSQLFEEISIFSSLDLIFACFPAENTWSAGTWNWVSALNESALKKTALLVLMSDKRKEEDLLVIREHMSELSVKKTGLMLPILMLAAAPKSGAPQLQMLYDYLEQNICESVEQKHLMHLAFQDNYRAIRDIDRGLDDSQRRLNDDTWFLEKLEQESHALRDLIVQDSEKSQEEGACILRDNINFIGRKLLWETGLLGTLWGIFFGAAGGAKIENEFEQNLQKLVTDCAERDLRKILKECHGHWGSIRPRVGEQMALDPGEYPTVLRKNLREKIADDFLTEYQRCIPHFLNTLRLRALVNKMLLRRSAPLRTAFGMWLVLVTIMALCGIFGLQGWTEWMFLSIVTIGVGLSFLFWYTRRKILQRVSEHVLNSYGQFNAALLNFRTQAIYELFKDYEQGFSAIRQNLVDRQVFLQPMSERANSLYLELKTIEQQWQKY